ncbi:MAG: hypothetical protein SNJ64_01580 [Endomicrobiia bacterium]
MIAIYQKMVHNEKTIRAIDAIYKYLNDHPQKDVIYFTEYRDLNARYNFTCMPSSEIHGFYGICIATDLQSIYHLLRVPTIKKIYYVFDLEWIYLNNFRYSDIRCVYENSDIDFVCRSEHHALCMRQVWGLNISKIVPDFNIELIVENVEKKFFTVNTNGEN